MFHEYVHAPVFVNEPDVFNFIFSSELQLRLTIGQLHPYFSTLIKAALAQLPASVCDLQSSDRDAPVQY